MTVRKSATDIGFIIFKDQLSLLKLFSYKYLGKSVKLVLENFDELPEINDIAYEMFASNVRRYREQAEKARESGLRGGNPTLKGTLKGTDNPTLKLQEKKRKENTIKESRNNTIPSLQEVIDYCKERNNNVDPNRWFDFYSANGWKVGKNQMKDWRACVRNWERNSTQPISQTKKESVWEHNMRVMKEMEDENNANEKLFW